MEDPYTSTVCGTCPNKSPASTRTVGKPTGGRVISPTKHTVGTMTVVGIVVYGSKKLAGRGSVIYLAPQFTTSPVICEPKTLPVIPNAFPEILPIT